MLMMKISTACREYLWRMNKGDLGEGIWSMGFIYTYEIEQ
jgi:hypothetical protein